MVLKNWTDVSSVLSQCTRLTDRQTDGQTSFSSLVRAGIPCSAEKNRVLQCDVADVRNSATERKVLRSRLSAAGGDRPIERRPT